MVIFIMIVLIGVVLPAAMYTYIYKEECIISLRLLMPGYREVGEACSNTRLTVSMISLIINLTGMTCAVVGFAYASSLTVGFLGISMLAVGLLLFSRIKYLYKMEQQQ